MLYLYSHPHIHTVVLGWIISQSVEPGIEPGTFRFQSKVLAGFLLHHFPLCIPPPLSSFSSSLSFSLSLFLCFSFCSSSTFFSCFSFSLLLLLAEKLTQKKKNKSSPEELVGFYSCHSTHNPFPQPIKIPLGGPLSLFSFRMGWRWIIETAVSIFLFFHIQTDSP